MEAENTETRLRIVYGIRKAAESRDGILESGPASEVGLDVGNGLDEELLVPRVVAQVVLDPVERHGEEARGPG
jgi:hypothetical protein